MFVLVKRWLATGLEPPRGVAGWDWWDPCRSSHVIEAMVAGSSPMHFFDIFCFAKVCPSQQMFTCRFIVHWTPASRLISTIVDTCDSSSSFCSLSCCLGMACSKRPTVHQVLESLRSWSLFEWLGQVVYPWIRACACGLSLAVWSLCHKPLARLPFVFAVWAFFLWHLYVQGCWVLLWECSGFIWLNGYGFCFTDVPAHLSHWVRIFMSFQICVNFRRWSGDVAVCVCYGLFT